MEQSRERSSALPTLWCSNYWKWSLWVTLDYDRQLLWPNIGFAQWIYLHRALYQEYLNSQNLNNLFVLTKLFPTLDLLDWRIPYIYIYIYIYIYTYGVYSISFQTFFVQAFKIVVDSWKFSMLFLYILWDDWIIFMISGSNEQLQKELEYSLLKPDCRSWWISKKQSGREDTLEERYAIKFCFKLGKNDTTEMYGMLQTAFGASCMSRTSGFEWHKRFKEGRESVRDDERCGRRKEVRTPVDWPKG